MKVIKESILEILRQDRTASEKDEGGSVGFRNGNGPAM